MDNVRIVFSDYDNTLTTNGWHGINEFALQAVLRLIESGIRFAPMSGRTHHEVPMMFRGHDECGMTGAFSNGMVVYVDGECVARKRVMRDSLERVRAICDELGDSVLTAGDNGIQSSVFITTNPRVVEENPSYFLRMLPFEPAVPKEWFTKANVHVCGSIDRLLEVQRILEDELPELDFVRPAQDIPVVDIVPAGWGKGAAAALVMQTLGIAPDEAIAFGDSENDLSMLQAVGHPVAVGNAEPALMDGARYVIGTCEDNAVAQALVALADAKRSGEPYSLRRILST